MSWKEFLGIVGIICWVVLFLGYRARDNAHLRGIALEQPVGWDVPDSYYERIQKIDLRRLRGVESITICPDSTYDIQEIVITDTSSVFITGCKLIIKNTDSDPDEFSIFDL